MSWHRLSCLITISSFTWKLLTNGNAVWKLKGNSRCFAVIAAESRLQYMCISSQNNDFGVQYYRLRGLWDGLLYKRVFQPPVYYQAKHGLLVNLKCTLCVRLRFRDGWVDFDAVFCVQISNKVTWGVVIIYEKNLWTPRKCRPVLLAGNFPPTHFIYVHTASRALAINVKRMCNLVCLYVSFCVVNHVNF